jgi:hypothetical protein
LECVFDMPSEKSTESVGAYCQMPAVSSFAVAARYYKSFVI